MLTVDLGNSRLKASRWRTTGGGHEPSASWEGAVGELGKFARWLGPAAAEPCALASVAGREATEAVRELLGAHTLRLFRAPDPGLEIRCSQPERVGEDRLYAAAGAAARCARSCVVVDAGTALTVDALKLEDGARLFLGGAIAPGPALLARALAGGTAQLPEVQPHPGARALGTFTEEAIEAGVVVGFRGAAERLVEEVAREAGLARAPVVLTGGAHAFLLAPGPFTTRECLLEPQLVQRGLLAALLRALERE